MMQPLWSRRASSVAACLRESVRDLRGIGEGRWRFVLDGDVPLPAEVALDSSFLCFDAPAPVECAFPEAEQWLKWNRTLGGNAKIVLLCDPWRVRLRAEMPVDEEAEGNSRMRETLRGLTQAASLLSGAGSFPAIAPQDVPDSRCDLAALLRENGCVFHERDGGAATVEFNLRGECSRALLKCDAAGLRAVMELLRSQPLSGSPRQATTVLLLSAGGALRVARPYAADERGEVSYGFEVRFAARATPVELDNALEALSVAAWTCKQEILSLLDNSVADSYVAIRQLPPLFAREELCHG